LRTGSLEEYLDLKGEKYPKADESYITRSLISPSTIRVIKSTRRGRVDNVSHMEWIRNEWGIGRKI
jgi:hypothetical protein